MTTTVKLPSLLEQSLRQRSTAVGRPISELIREALTAYLMTPPAQQPSAWSLGQDLFNRMPDLPGPPDLAERRKDYLQEIWADKHARRSAAPAAKARRD